MAQYQDNNPLVVGYREKNQTAKKGGVVFAGSSLMEMFPVEKFFAELQGEYPPVYNRGVGGYTTINYAPILDICVWDLAPRKVFINIGTNDLSDPTQTIPEIMARYDQIITQIEEHLPGVQIYLMAYYPMNPEAAEVPTPDWIRVRTNEKLLEANAEVEKLAARHGQKYIDVNAPLKDDLGRLKAEYTIEGVHITEEGYRSIFDEIVRYVME